MVWPRSALWILSRKWHHDAAAETLPVLCNKTLFLRHTGTIAELYPGTIPGRGKMVSRQSRATAYSPRRGSAGHKTGQRIPA